MHEGPLVHKVGSWAASGTGLYATLQVLGDMDADGGISLPANITHVVIEVGANARDWLWNEAVPLPVPGIMPGVKIRDQGHVLLLAFEPLLDKYAKYLSILTHSDSLWPPPPGWSVRERAIVLPFAITTQEEAARGTAVLHVADVDGCSSLLPINGTRVAGNWNATALMRLCGRSARRVRVPAVSLETVVGTWLRGREVSFVKVDAQGFDLRVAQSAGVHAQRIRSMKLEVTADECRASYEGALTCSPIVEGMRLLGFAPAGGECAAQRWRNHGCAADVLFERRRR